MYSVVQIEIAALEVDVVRLACLQYLVCRVKCVLWTKYTTTTNVTSRGAETFRDGNIIVLSRRDLNDHDYGILHVRLAQRDYLVLDLSRYYKTINICLRHDVGLGRRASATSEQFYSYQFCYE